MIKAPRWGIWNLARGTLKWHANRKAKQITPVIKDEKGNPAATQAQLADVWLGKILGDFANRGEVTSWEDYLDLYDEVCDDMPVTVAPCVGRAFWKEQMSTVLGHGKEGQGCWGRLVTHGALCSAW